jgi:hypothetical protein
MRDSHPKRLYRHCKKVIATCPPDGRRDSYE